MKAMIPIAAFVFALAAMPAHAVGNEAKRGVFHGVVHVAEDGRIRVDELEGVSGALADAVRSQLETRTALPAMREGRAVAAMAPLSGTVVLTSDGDRFDIALAHVALSPKAVRRAPFNYPVESMRDERAGWVEVEFRLDADGAPVDIRIVHASHPSFAKAVAKPLAAWRFAVKGVDPALRHRLTARFHTDAKTPTPAFECPHDPSQPRLEGQPGCIDALDIHGSRAW